MFLLVLQIVISGTALVTLHPVVLVVLIACAGIRQKVNGKLVQWEVDNRDKWQQADLKSQYIIDKTGDFEFGKEIRLHQAVDWLMPKFHRFLGERLD